MSILSLRSLGGPWRACRPPRGTRSAGTDSRRQSGGKCREGGELMNKTEEMMETYGDMRA